MTKEKTFVVVRGLPGSGKSTFAGLFEGAVVLSTDDYWGGDRPFDPSRLGEAHAWNKKRASDAFRDGIPFVVLANTACREWEFQVYIDDAVEAGYKVFSVVVENRHGGENVHGVPPGVTAGMERTFQIRVGGKTRDLVPPSWWARFKKWLDDCVF